MKKLVVILFLLIGLVLTSRSAFALALWGIDFDSGSGVLVGITITTPMKFVSINFATGVATVLNADISAITRSGDGGGGTLSNVRSHCIDPGNHLLYLVHNVNDVGYVISINTSTGVVSWSPALHF